MKTEVTMNKKDLITMIKESIGKTAGNINKVSDITVCVVLKDDSEHDFKEIRFTFEVS